MTALHSLRVRNFQSLHDVSLDLLPFTVIVGPSSSGKSALTRAIKTLVTNRRGTEWITHGERVASITATTPAGTVTLTRSRATASSDNAYTIIPADNPEAQRTYSKLGGETPADVSRFLGIRATSPSTAPINFAGQFDKPYLLDDSTAEVARTLGSLTNVSVIFDGARESNRRKLSHAATLKLRAADLEAVRARVPEFQALKAQDAALTAAEAAIERARSLGRRISRLSQALDTLETTLRTLPGLEALNSTPVPDETRVLRAQEALSGFRKRVALVPTYAAALKAAQDAYEAVERQETETLARYDTLTGAITRDLRGFFTASLDTDYVVTRGDRDYVETGHAVEIFLRFLEAKSGR